MKNSTQTQTVVTNKNFSEISAVELLLPHFACKVLSAAKIHEK